MLWRKGKIRICRTLRRPAKRYRQVMLMYESPEIKFDPLNILFRNLDKIFLLKHGNIMILTIRQKMPGALRDGGYGLLQAKHAARIVLIRTTKNKNIHRTVTHL